MGKIDGKLTIEDILTALLAMVAITLCLGVAGGGFELVLIIVAVMDSSYSFRGFFFGLGVGALIGALTAAIRIGLDLVHKGHESSTEGIDWGGIKNVIPPQDERTGLRIEVQCKSHPRVLFSCLLEDLERNVIIKMLRKVALITMNTGPNFSKRKTGGYFGERLPEVRDEFERLGFIKVAGVSKHAGYVFTELGIEFLRHFEGDTPVLDPIVLETD